MALHVSYVMNCILFSVNLFSEHDYPHCFEGKYSFVLVAMVTNVSCYNRSLKVFTRSN